MRALGDRMQRSSSSIVKFRGGGGGGKHGKCLNNASCGQRASAVELSVWWWVVGGEWGTGACGLQEAWREGFDLN